jgi:hypothetical protein
MKVIQVACAYQQRTLARAGYERRKSATLNTMKHPKQNRRAPLTHSSALAVPSYHRILVKHGLIEKTLSIPDAYKVFLKVGADPEVQKLCRKVEPHNRMKHVPALYLATAMALQGMTKQELETLKLRIESKRVSAEKKGATRPSPTASF